MISVTEKDDRLAAILHHPIRYRSDIYPIYKDHMKERPKTQYVIRDLLISCKCLLYFSPVYII